MDKAVKWMLGLMIAAIVFKIESYWFSSKWDRLAADWFLLITTANACWYIGWLKNKYDELKRHADILSGAIRRLLTDKPISPGEWARVDCDQEKVTRHKDGSITIETRGDILEAEDW